MAAATDGGASGKPVLVGVLGPLVVTVDGRPVAVTAGRLRALLAALAMGAGQPVPVDRLTRALWDEDPPDRPRRSLHTYVTRLRGLVGADLIGTRPEGYLMRVEPDAVDALRFGQLLDTALACDDPDKRRARLAEALELWRGEPFEDLRAGWLAQTEAPRLVERYLAAVEQRVDLDLAAGQPEALVAELDELTARHPLRESLWARLLVVLERSGRPAEALSRYETIRARLADELGAAPGPRLQQVYADLLAGTAEARPGDARPEGAAPEPARPVPRQLPAVPPGFTGRAAELAELDRVHDASTVVITAIGGMAGVGKTALALQAGHQLSDRFPDGQLFVDLHGYTQGVAPVEPGEALDRMLRSLGVPGEQIPRDMDERAALYRSRLAGRRVLIVLDNAATERQVTPLVPGTAGCQVLVTSRRRLTGLDDTHTVSLDTLPRDDAVALFTRTAGERLPGTAPPELLADTVELCGRLPLAIRIAAARLRSHPVWTVADLVERLRAHQHRLAELEAGQRSVTAALDLSYQQLGAAERRAYRLLGLHPGADVDAYAAAALTGTPVDRARRLLDHLLEAHLVQERVAGRFLFHDLVRVHAAATATRDETAVVRRAAADRLLDHYARTASVAMAAAHPYEPERRPPVPPEGPPTPPLDRPAEAHAWLDTELSNLLATAGYAAVHHRPDHVPHLSATLYRHLRSRGRYAEAEALHTEALHAARATGDTRGEQRALMGIADAHRLRGWHHKGAPLFAEALALATAAGDRVCEVDALLGVAHVHRMQDRTELAGECLARALDVARDIGHPSGEVEALLSLGHVVRKQGEHERASERFAQALEVARSIGHRAGELDALIGLGRVHLLQGEYERAVDNFVPAVEVTRTIGYRPGELSAITGLGDGHRLLGRFEQADAAYQYALSVAREIGDRNWQFEALNGLGRLHHVTGRPARALAGHDEALRLATTLGQRADQARAHDGVARAHLALGRPEAAREHWQRALEILTDLGTDHTEEDDVNAASIRARLARL